MLRATRPRTGLVFLLIVGSLLSACGSAPPSRPAMLQGETTESGSTWTTRAIFTVGDSFGEYEPPGLLDGLGAYRHFWSRRVRVLAAHELRAEEGSTYSLANGTVLKGARVTEFGLDRKATRVLSAGLAYDTVYDRAGREVTSAEQINETGSATAGFSRFCSARLVEAGERGFEDRIFFLNEEIGMPYHPRGGSVWAMDVDERTVWAVPGLGRGAWENVAPLETGSADQVALLLGDDYEGAPLHLYVGKKNSMGDGSFLDRNGLADGQLYVWKSHTGERSPEQFRFTGRALGGSFVPIQVRMEANADQPGYDSLGYLDESTLRARHRELGAFQFSKPEDLHEDPQNPARAVFASAGGSEPYPSDLWGTVYLIDVDFSQQGSVEGDLTILFSADELAVPDLGVRNPDNLTWGRDGWIYIQEDRATDSFGTVGGEASIWRISTDGMPPERVARIDRSAVLPEDASDLAAKRVGVWEASGIIDLSELLGAQEFETVLLTTVQAHSIRGGEKIMPDRLVEGGQLLLLGNRPERWSPKQIAWGSIWDSGWRFGIGCFFLIAGVGCIVAVALGLPGAWILIGLAVVIELTDQYMLNESPALTFGWWLLIVCTLLALIGEGLEFGAGALGAKSGGSSRWGMTGAVLGGIAGAIAGIFIPMPAIGSLIGAVIGTFLGALLAEMAFAKARLDDSLRPATGATIGRILGTVAKLPIALVIWVALTVAAFWP